MHLHLQIFSICLCYLSLFVFTFWTFVCLSACRITINTLKSVVLQPPVFSYYCCIGWFCILIISYFQLHIFMWSLMLLLCKTKLFPPTCPDLNNFDFCRNALYDTWNKSWLEVYAHVTTIKLNAVKILLPKLLVGELVFFIVNWVHWHFALALVPSGMKVYLKKTTQLCQRESVECEISVRV